MGQTTGVSSANRGQGVNAELLRPSRCVFSFWKPIWATLGPEGIPKGRPWSRSGFWVGKINCDLGRTEQSPCPPGCLEAFPAGG